MPSLITSLPATIRILLVFILILFVIKRKWALGNAFMLGAGSLGLAFGMGPWRILQTFLTSALLPKSLSLAVMVSLILVLSFSLEKSGQMERLLEAYQGLVRGPN